MNRNQVKQFILHNQHITNPIEQEQVVKDMCGLQAQFFNNPRRALRVRSVNYKDALWKEHMLKTWTLRGTLHMIHQDDYSLFMSLHEYPSWFEKYYSKIDLESIQTLVMEYLKTSDHISRKTLASLMLANGYDEKVILIATNAWGGIFMKLSHDGKVVFSDITNRDFSCIEAFEKVNADKAKLELVRRYFLGYGPATLNDVSYFTKFKKSELRKIIDQLDLLQCIVEKRVYYYFKTDNKMKRIPKVILLGPLIL